MPMTVLNGAAHYVDVVGTGPPLLMLHGNGLDHTCLRPWHDDLARDARVIYYDLRWHGRSAREGGADHATWHADAAALLDHLGESRAVIFGHSYGSWLALGFARRFPERVKALVLCATAPAFDYTDVVIANALARNPEAAAALIGGLSQPVTSDADLAAIWQRILPLYFTGLVRDDVLANTRYSAAGFQFGQEALAGFSVVDDLPTMNVPMLVLVGRDDYITPPAQARRLASLAPNATVVELEHSGHFPFVEENATYIAAVRAWLATLPS